MKAKTINESAVKARQQSKMEFLDWLDHAMDTNPDADWKLIVSAMVNDESDNDTELFDYFAEEIDDHKLITDVILHRSGFLCYGLDIPYIE